MQKSKITIGEEYAVWIDGLNAPMDEYPSYGDPIKTPHGVIFQGVPPEHKRGRWAVERYIVRAKVVALDQPRVTSASGYSRYYSTRSDGVVVEFHKPVEVGYYADSKTKLASATLTTKHILEPWAEYAADRRAEKAAEAEQRREADRRAEEFAPFLERTLAVLRERFETVTVHEDNSGIEFYDDGYYRSGSIPLATREGTKGRRLAYGFGGDTRVNTNVLLDLLGLDGGPEEED